MSRSIVLGLAVLFAGAVSCDVARAQTAGVATDPAAESWQYDSPYDAYRLQPRDIIVQKAAARAQQRMARMASMKWYGMSNARPTANPTPFTSLYSPVWQMPGNRPFAWYRSSWPTIVVLRPEVEVQR